MNLIQAVVIAVVEGVTEFLPISSTGHMILTANLLGIPNSEFLGSFEIFIQVGAIMAALVVSMKSFPINKKSLLRLSSSFIPTVFIGLLSYKTVKYFLLGNVNITLGSLLIGGFIIIFFERLNHSKNVQTLHNLTLKNALIIGMFQSLSIIPGVSRSAATIIGAMIVGLNRTDAVSYSFALAVPTMLAATTLDLLSIEAGFSSSELMILAIGFIAAFISAYMTVRVFLSYVRTKTLTPFGIYRIILAIILFPILR